MTQSPVPAGPSFLRALIGIAFDGSPWQYMLRLRREGFKDIARVPLGPAGDFYFLQSAQTVKQVCVDDATSFPRRFSVPLFSTLQLDKGIVYEQGARHKRQKRLCIPSFENSVSMESFLEAVQEEALATSEDWKRRLQAGGGRELKLDLYRELRRTTLSVVLRVTFGLGGAAREYDKAEELSEVIGAYLEAIVATANEIPPLWQIAPRLSANYVAVTETLLPRLRELVSDVIAQRRTEDLQGGAGGEEGLTDEDIQYILFDLIIAGSDTTASTLTAALFLLHQPQHARALAAAREEAATTDVRGVGLNDIRNALPFATAIARETLRLYPPVPFIGRTSVVSETVGALEIPSGSTMCWSPFYLGREPTSWGADAAEFRPERWIADPISGGAPSPFCWLPFGAGARGCLGTRLGLTEAVVGVSALLREFEFDFERDELKYKYDLTLNLEGCCVCAISRAVPVESKEKS